jgi:spectrin alpha
VQAFLVNEDLGDSLDSVEALSKKHDDFEKSLAAQEEKIKVCV